MRTIALSMVLGMAVLVSAGVQRVDAGVLYGATGSGGVNGELYILDQTTGGVIQDIGALVDSDGKHYSITGLAFQPGTGVLYGVTAANSPTDPKWLVSINPTTALVTAIGALGTLNNKPLADITFSGGTLYGANASLGALYTVDTTTGASTRISSSNNPITTGSGGHGLAAQGGTLFTTPDGASRNLYTYDATTGAGTIVTGLSGAPISDSINALAFDGALPTLYGVNSEENSPSHTHLITIDTTTGVITDIGASVTNLDAIAFAVVPEPSTLVSLVAGLAGVLGYVARRRSIA